MQMMTRRAEGGLAVVTLCAIVPASRVRTVAGEPRVTVGPRVVQLIATITNKCAMTLPSRRRAISRVSARVKFVRQTKRPLEVRKALLTGF
jgi:hypothetical protein